MSWIILVIALFFTQDGPPQPYAVVLQPGIECNDEVAAVVVAHMAMGKKFLGYDYSCDKTSDPPDPAKKPAKKHVPGDREA